MDDNETAGPRACRRCGKPTPRPTTAYCGHACRSADWRAADPRNQMVADAKYRARQQNLPFRLTVDDITMTDRCPILGTPFVPPKNGRPHDLSPSLDKIVPELGYVPGNVLVVSMRANRAKSNLRIWELRRMADYYEHYIATGQFLAPSLPPQE